MKVVTLLLLEVVVMVVMMVVDQVVGMGYYECDNFVGGGGCGVL